MRPREPRNTNSQANRKKAEGLRDWNDEQARKKDREWLASPDPFRGYQPRSPWSGRSSGPRTPPAQMPTVPKGGKRKPSWTQTWI